MNDPPDNNLKNPGVDFVVSRVQLEQVDINAALADEKSLECLTVNRRLENLHKERPKEQSDALRLLVSLTGYHFVPDHKTEPFKPMLVMDGRRSLVPTDLQSAQIDVIAAFAPTVEHFGLRARLADVAWFMQRQRHYMADMAIAAYCNSVHAVREGRAVFSHGNTSAWGYDAKQVLLRAASISYATKWELPSSKQIKLLLHDLVTTAQQQGRSDDFLCIAAVSFLHGDTPPAQLAAWAKGLAGDARLKDNPLQRVRLLEFAEQAYRYAKDEENANCCMVDAAECYVQQADFASSSMIKAKFLQDAIQALRLFPETRERRDELTDRLREAQSGIGDEMKLISVTREIEPELVQHSIASVRGHSWPTAFLSLVSCDQPPTPDKIREAAMQHARSHPLQAHISIQVHDFQGRCVFRMCGIENEDDYLRHLMAFLRNFNRQLAVAAAINPMRMIIASEHPISTEMIQELLRGSFFIPPGHEYIYARAIYHFLNRDDLEAISLLAPQLENSLRHMLALNGHDTTTQDAQGIQTEASLSILLNPDKPWRALLEKSIPPAYIHEIDLLFNFAGGPSIRNQVSHGKVPTGQFWQHNFTYAAWLIIQMAILPVVGHWHKG